MAWIATDNFDSYSTTVDLATLNGGSGWSGAWSRESGTGTFTIQTAPAGGQGGNAAWSGTGPPADYVRSFTAITAGTFFGRIIVSTLTPNDDVGFILGDGASYYMYVLFKSPGNIQIYNEGVAGYETIQAYSINTWYSIEIDFDDAAQPNLYRARVDSGTWTPYKTVVGSSYSTISRLRLAHSASTVSPGSYFDDIRAGGAVAAATLMGAMCL